MAPRKRKEPEQAPEVFDVTKVVLIASVVLVLFLALFATTHKAPESVDVTTIEDSVTPPSKSLERSPGQLMNDNIK